jgi:nicotinamide-nucleotide amidase
MNRKRSIIEILAVGSEFLTPFYQDTNSLYITQRLNDLGWEVNYKSIVGDKWDDLVLSMKQAAAKANLIIAIGGLGPTRDDMTREACAAVLERRLVFREDLLQTIQERFARRNMKMPEVNKKQAFIIEGAEVLANTTGTAPGLWVESEEKTFILLPGPPHEMKAMFEDFIWSRLSSFPKKHTSRRVIKTAGLTESKIESWLADIYPRIPHVQLTTLARPGQIEIHLLSLSEKSLSQAERYVSAATELIRKKLKQFIFTETGKELEELVGEILTKKKKTLAVAESCTGGHLGNRITNVPGSSAYFLQGILAYSNNAKIHLLDVPSGLIDEYGAVSAQVGKAMAVGIRKKAKADYGLAITGIAGPSGGSIDKPVGLVYTALSWAKGVRVKKNLFLGDRNAIKYQSSQTALDMLRQHFLADKQNKGPQKEKNENIRRHRP